MKYLLGLFLIGVILWLVPQHALACTIKFPCFPEKDCCSCDCQPTPKPTPTSAPSPTITPSPTPEITSSPAPSPTPTPSSPPQGGTNGGGGGGGGGGPVGAPSCDALVPGTSRLISAISSGQGGVDLKWTPAGLATHYSISYGLEPGKYIYGISNTGNVTSFTVWALDPNKNYCFTVLPVNDCQPNSYSNEICTKSGGLVLGEGEVLGLSYTKSGNHYFYYLILAVLGLLGLKLVKENA